MIEEKQNNIINKLDKTKEIIRFKELEAIISNNTQYAGYMNKLKENLSNQEKIEIRKVLFSNEEIKEYARLENEIRLFSRKVSEIISSVVDTHKC